MRRNAIRLSKSLRCPALYSSLDASTWSSTLFIFIYTVCVCVCALQAKCFLASCGTLRCPQFQFFFQLLPINKEAFRPTVQSAEMCWSCRRTYLPVVSTQRSCCSSSLSIYLCACVCVCGNSSEFACARGAAWLRLAFLLAFIILIGDVVACKQ